MPDLAEHIHFERMSHDQRRLALIDLEEVKKRLMEDTAAGVLSIDNIMSGVTNSLCRSRILHKEDIKMLQVYSYNKVKNINVVDL